MKKNHSPSFLSQYDPLALITWICWLGAILGLYTTFYFLATSRPTASVAGGLLTLVLLGAPFFISHLIGQTYAQIESNSSQFTSRRTQSIVDFDTLDWDDSSYCNLSEQPFSSQYDRDLAHDFLTDPDASLTPEEWSDFHRDFQDYADQ